MISLGAVTPIFLLTADGALFNASRVLRIEVTDAAGYESDELQITLDDCVPQIERPREGAKLALSLGFKEWGPPIFVGTYVFEELERNGFERTLVLVAKAADHTKGLKEPRTRSFEGKTFGQIVETIAKANNLKPVMSKALAAHPISYAAQTEESDQNFLTRLGRKIGAVVAPKDGNLLVTERRSGKTASGQDLPTVLVTPSRLVAPTAYRVKLKPRSRYSKVVAKWQDRGAGSTKPITLETGQKGPSMTLREVFQSEAEARKAAETKVKELRAGEGELSFELVGDPRARAEAPIKVIGVGLDADGDWIATKVSHTWDYSNGGGAITTIEAEFGKDEKDDKEGAKKKKTTQKSSNQSNGDYVSILDR